MNLITKEVIQAGKNNDNISGIAMIRNYGIALTKKGSEYEQGTLLAGIEIGFKAWNDSAAFNSLKREDYTNMPCIIVGKFNEFNGQMSLIIDSVQAVDGYTIDQFLPIKYNIDAYWSSLQNLVNSQVSDKAKDIASKVLFANESLAHDFQLEFAAMTYHDNCKSGLLAHTYKVVANTNYLIQVYPKTIERDGAISQDKKDLLILGALFHDIGKTREMNLGVYQSVSIAKHPYLGAEFVAKYKEEIIQLYSEDWYYELISVILQHHGEFGEPPKTLSAYIVYRADELDAVFTNISELLEQPIINPTAGDTIKLNGTHLTI